SVIVNKTGTVFLGGPQLVRAATGEIVDAEDLGGADLHTRLSGVADHFAQNDHHALSIIRGILARSTPPVLQPTPSRVRPPLYPPEELLGIVSENVKEPIPALEVLARLLDGSEFMPYRERFGPTIVCGTGRIMGYPVGILINDGALYSESAQKAANFIELCCQSNTPLLFLHNISGFMVGRDYEAGGIAKNGAKMVNAVATSRVPKLSLIIGGSYGAGTYAMCGRAFDPRLMGMWPNARTSVMGGEQAATVLAMVKREGIERKGGNWSREEEAEFRAPILEKYEREGHPLYSSARLWDDGIIDPAKTREVLALSLSAALNAPVPETKFGVFRM
ncbi:carboxyl transferase domain-containing protein, partial [Rhizobiaceae sp. 2RAB30]